MRELRLIGWFLIGFGSVVFLAVSL